LEIKAFWYLIGKYIHQIFRGVSVCTSMPKKHKKTAVAVKLSSLSSSSSSSSHGATALREPWPHVLFASTGLYPELSFSILQSPSLVGPLERHLAI
jgi:hypothetical protein